MAARGATTIWQVKMFKNLECVGVRKQYGDAPYSLGKNSDGINLSISTGELFAVIGPSGCGKSTLLRILGGFTEPSAGSITIGNRDITKLAPNVRPTNMVFQNYALFSHLTIWDNVSFGLEMEATPRAERQKRVAEALDLVGLTGFGDRHVGELSGGQLQRAALARALVKQPSVLLLDEPLGALDLKLRRQMQDEIVRLKDALGMTIILVTHDQEEACAMADRIAVLNEGIVRQVASPVELYKSPKTTFVAEFLHSGTVVRGSCSQPETSSMLIQRSGLAVLGTLAMPYSGGPVAAVLPRHGAEVRRANPVETCQTNEIKAQIVRLAFTGVDFSAQLKLADGFVVAVQLSPELVSDLGISIGTDVIAKWRSDQIRIIEDDIVI
jgi:spermidine/putrescine transport system ATP-binding protein